MTPVWFGYRHGTWWIGCAASPVKARNRRARPAVTLTLQDGRAPVVAEGIATIRTAGSPVPVVEAFSDEYDGSDVRADRTGARALIEVPTTRRLLPGVAQWGGPLRSIHPTANAHTARASTSTESAAPTRPRTPRPPARNSVTTAAK